MSKIEDKVIEALKREIEIENLSCIVLQDEVLYTHIQKGVKPIVDFWSRDYLEDAVVVDKVIGKASAIFMVNGNVRHAHGIVVSELAVEVFEKAGIDYSADKIVPKIINRTGDGLCPMESSVAHVNENAEAIKIILEKIYKSE